MTRISMNFWHENLVRKWKNQLKIKIDNFSNAEQLKHLQESHFSPCKSHFSKIFPPKVQFTAFVTFLIRILTKLFDFIGFFSQFCQFVDFFSTLEVSTLSGHNILILDKKFNGDRFEKFHFQPLQFVRLFLRKKIWQIWIL